MMLKKLDSYINIIFEGFQNNDNKDLIKDQTLAIIPGLFKPPCKEDWKMIMNYVNMDKIDKVIILISNVSSIEISNRPLSLTNLKELGKIKTFIDDNHLNDDELKSIFDLFDKTINNLSFSLLKDAILNKIVNICDNNYQKNKKYGELKVIIIDYMNDLESKLFKSVKIHNNNEITPIISKDIFKIFINAYNVEDKIEVKISDEPSPIAAAINFINYYCINCKILLGTSKNGFNSIKSAIKNKSIDILPFNDDNNFISYNHLNITKDIFPDQLTDDDFKKIKDLIKF